MREWLARLQPVGLLTALWPYVRPERRRLALAAVVTLGVTLVEVASPLLIGRFVDAVLYGPATAFTPSDGSPGRVALLALLALLVAAALARGVLLAAQGTLAGATGEQVAARLRQALWAHLQRLPLEYTERRGSGRLLLRFTSDARAVQRFVAEGLVRVGQDLSVALAISVTLMLLNWRMALPIAALVPIYGVLFWRLNPALRRASEATRRRRSRLSAYLNERIVGMKVIKAFARQRAEASSIDALNRDVAARGSRQAAAGARLRGAATTAFALAMVAVLIVAAAEVEAGRMTAGSLVAFFTLTGLLGPIFRRLATANRSMQEAAISVTRLQETLAARPEDDGDRRRPALKIRRGQVNVERVSFRYSDGTRALRRVSLRARRGEVVALCGPNGAGKSSLFDLLLRFHAPRRGRIRIDGQDVAAVSLASLRSQVGLVAQDAPLFSGTIADNVAYGVRRDGSQRGLPLAVKLAGLGKLVASLPDGWDTEIGPGARDLSAGQRQRVALARALAVDPPILLLDEASAALDAESERELAETLRTLARHKTVIVAAHRPATLRAADRIYVLDRGRVVEEGTHATLAQPGTLYDRLYRAGADDDEDDERPTDGEVGNGSAHEVDAGAEEADGDEEAVSRVGAR